MAAEIVIRSADPQDGRQILDIYAYYVLHTAVSFEKEVPTPEEFCGRIRRTLQRYPYLVAQQGDQIVGYAYAGPFVGRAAYDWSCELSIYVDPQQRRRGIGRRLYEELEQRLKAMGIRNLYACIGYPGEQEDEYLTKDSERFHQRLGFQTVGRFHRCGNKFSRWYDMIWMEKIIADHPEDPAPVRFGG